MFRALFVTHRRRRHLHRTLLAVTLVTCALWLLLVSCARIKVVRALEKLSSHAPAAIKRLQLWFGTHDWLHIALFAGQRSPVVHQRKQNVAYVTR